MTRKKPSGPPAKIVDWPSHNRFCDLISFCVRGHKEPAFENSCCDDHIAELVMLKLDDTDEFFWFNNSPPDGVALHQNLEKLTQRIQNENDLEAAKLLYAIATYAAFEVLGLYLRNRDLFDQITPLRSLLPCLISIHPNTAKAVAEMEGAARLGQQTQYAKQIRSKAWFTSDAPANVYARAIITCVEMNQDLDSIEEQRKEWASYDREHSQDRLRTRVLPFPAYIEGLELLPVPMTPASVMAYWRKGKEMILEELPDFHSRPEWAAYHQRTYKHGAKPGAIQHAIFKDILVALRTIAGANTAEKAVRVPGSKSRKK